MQNGELVSRDLMAEAKREAEWARIVADVNIAWPGQQLAVETADLWYGHLSGFPMGEVRAAIHRCLRERPFLPQLAEVLGAIDANWREAAERRRELEAAERRAARNAQSGHAAPPEFTTARKILEASTLPPDHPDHVPGPLARQRIEALADQLDERIALQASGRMT